MPNHDLAIRKSRLSSFPMSSIASPSSSGDDGAGTTTDAREDKPPPPPPLSSLSSPLPSAIYLDSRIITSEEVLISPGAFDEIKAAILHSDDHAIVQQAAQNLRRILSICGENSPPIQMVTQAGLLPRLVSMLANDDHPLTQLEIAWSLSNIVAAGSPSDTSAVVHADACPQLIRLLSSPNEDVREHCLKALGHMAEDSRPYKSMLRRIGCLPALITLLNDSSRLSVIQNSLVSTLSSLLKGKPAPSLDDVALVAPHLAKLIVSADLETVTNACWALAYATNESTMDKIQSVLDQGVAPRVVELLNSGNTALQTPALGIIGNISRSLRALLGSGIYACSQVYAVDLQFIKTYICKSQTRKLHLFLQSN